MNDIISYFPAEANVDSNQVEKAMTSFSEKFSKSTQQLETEIEIEKFQNGEEEITCTLKQYASTATPTGKKDKPKQQKNPNLSTAASQSSTSAKSTDTPLKAQAISVSSKIISISTPPSNFSAALPALPVTATIVPSSHPPPLLFPRPRILDRRPPILPALSQGYTWDPPSSFIFDEPL
jgi:hypothetical protein